MHCPHSPAAGHEHVRVHAPQQVTVDFGLGDEDDLAGRASVAPASVMGVAAPAAGPLAPVLPALAPAPVASSAEGLPTPALTPTPLKQDPLVNPASWTALDAQELLLGAPGSGLDGASAATAAAGVPAAADPANLWKEFRASAVHDRERARGLQELEARQQEIREQQERQRREEQDARRRAEEERIESERRERERRLEAEREAARRARELEPVDGTSFDDTFESELERKLRHGQL